MCLRIPLRSNILIVLYSMSILKTGIMTAFSLTVPDKESLRLIPYSGFGRGRLNCRYAKRIGVALYRRCGV